LKKVYLFYCKKLNKERNQFTPVVLCGKGCGKKQTLLQSENCVTAENSNFFDMIFFMLKRRTEIGGRKGW
jgi:hypothetical protein